MNIAMIDDEAVILENAKRCAENEITRKDEAEIFTYTNAEEFLQAVEQGLEFDILVLDIELPGMSGMELGRRIQEQKLPIYLVFLTAYSEYAAQSYTLEAYQYILKDDMVQRLPMILRQLLDRVKREKKQFRMIGTPTSKEQVYYRDIICIEKEKASKYLRYETIYGAYKERISLVKLKEELESEEFVQVERKYIINVNHIASIKDNRIKMDNDMEIVVSRVNSKKVKKQINLYRGSL